MIDFYFKNKKNFQFQFQFHLLKHWNRVQPNFSIKNKKEETTFVHTKSKCLFILSFSFFPFYLLSSALKRSLHQCRNRKQQQQKKENKKMSSIRICIFFSLFLRLSNSLIAHTTDSGVYSFLHIFCKGGDDSNFIEIGFKKMISHKYTHKLTKKNVDFFFKEMLSMCSTKMTTTKM